VVESLDCKEKKEDLWLGRKDERDEFRKMEFVFWTVRIGRSKRQINRAQGNSDIIRATRTRRSDRSEK